MYFKHKRTKKTFGHAKCSRVHCPHLKSTVHTHTSSLRYSVTIFVADAMLYTVWSKYGMDMSVTINHLDRPSSLLGRDTQLTLASDKVQNLFVSFKHQNLLNLSNNGHFSKYLSEISASGPNFTIIKSRVSLIVFVIYLLTWKCKGNAKESRRDMAPAISLTINWYKQFFLFSDAKFEWSFWTVFPPNCTQ